LEGDGVDSEKSSCLYTLKWSPLVVITYQVRCVDVYCGFPHVVTFGVPLPFDQILKGPVSSGVTMVLDLLHFILHLITDQVQGRLGEVWPVCGHFAIGR